MTSTLQTKSGPRSGRVPGYVVALDPPEAHFLDFWARLWRGEPAGRRVPVGTPEVLDGWTARCQDAIRSALPGVAGRLLVEVASRGTADSNGQLVTFEGGRRYTDRMPWQAWAECDAPLRFSRRFFATLWSAWVTGRWPASGPMRAQGRPPRPVRGETAGGVVGDGGAWSAPEELLWYAALRTVHSWRLDELGACEEPGALGLCSWLVYGGIAALQSGCVPAAPPVNDGDPRLPVLLVAIHGDVGRQWLRDERAMRQGGLWTVRQLEALSAYRRRAAETLAGLAARWERPDVLTPLYEAWQRLFGRGAPDPRGAVACVERAVEGLRLSEQREVIDQRLIGLYGWVEVLVGLEREAGRVDSYSDDFERARTLSLLRHRASRRARNAVARVLRDLRGEV